MDQRPGRRITVRGLSGSGKTTLARDLSQRLAIPHTELDELYWKPGWTPSTDEEFQPKVEQLASQPEWIVCGNYSRCRKRLDQRADTIIWLDYPFLLILGRLLNRCVTRSRRKELLWGHCQESLWNAFFGKDALVWWIFRVRRRQKKQMEAIFSSPEPEKTYLRFRHPRQTQDWLQSVAPAIRG